MKKFRLSLPCFIALFLMLHAISVRAEELWLKNISVTDLKKLYQQSSYEGFKSYLMIPDHKYPPIFLENFPKGFASITNETERNALFIKIVAPLALKLNQDILKERQVIVSLNETFEKENKLSDKEINLLEKKAEKYDIFSRLKGPERYTHLLTELLKRVDIIAPSIMITAAAIDTNWGTARITAEGNSLYKTYLWHTEKGLKPLGEKEDNSYHLKTYPSLYASMEEFALKINSQRAFHLMRVMRDERRPIEQYPSGLLMAPYLLGNSPLKNYAGLFEYTMAYYEFLEIDKSSLADNMITKDLIQKYSRYRIKK